MAIPGACDPLVKHGWDTGVQMRKERGSMRRTLMSVMAIASLWLMFHLIAAEAQPPDATLTWTTVSMADGVGYSWGEGVLTFQGHAYPFRVEALSVGEMGVSKAEATGNVYHLTTIEDFSGEYVAASAGAAIAGGRGIATMRNQHGVVIDLTAIDQGIELKFAVEGVKISVEGAEPAPKGH
jgi:outer membrane immunogenic protein